MKCRVCGDDKDAEAMKSCNGKPCRICRKCDGQGRTARYRKKPKSRARRDRINAAVRRACADGDRRDFFVCKWSKSSDKRKGRDNDMTREFVREMLAKPCEYCGQHYKKMTLDRMDNTLGHLQTNVVPCCVRCNYIRRDIPYAAWKLIAAAVKEATELGLFGEWTGAWRITGKDLETLVGAVPTPAC